MSLSPDFSQDFEWSEGTLPWDPSVPGQAAGESDQHHLDDAVLYSSAAGPHFLFIPCSGPYDRPLLKGYCLQPMNL